MSRLFNPMCKSIVLFVGVMFHAVLCQPLNAVDNNTMLFLRQYFNGSGNIWNTTGNDPCTWSNVICSGGSVTNIDLRGLALNRTIPTEFGMLSQLRYLDLSFSGLSGTIPSQFGMLVELRDFYIYSNPGINGTIPTTLGRLTQLTSLFLDTNPNLVGPIPTELGLLTRLEKLWVAISGLTGPIPSQFGSLTQLTELAAHENSLSGTIPTELGLMTRMRRIFLLRLNQFSGTLPTELALMTQMLRLDVRGNRLSGTIPSHLGSLGQIQTINLDSNNFVGSLPTELDNLTRLTSCDASNNFLTSCSGVVRCVCTTILPTPTRAPSNTPQTTSTTTRAPSNTPQTTSTLVQTLLQSLPSSETSSSAGVIVGALFAVVAVIVITVIVVCVLVKRRRQRRLDQQETLSSSVNSEQNHAAIDTASSPVVVIDTQIGEGNFGNVYRGTFNGVMCALKTVVALDSAEVEILRSLRHANVVSYLGVGRNSVDNQFYVAMELMNRGALLHLLQSQPNLLRPILLQVAQQCAAGMKYLHDNNVIHRDLAARNVLVSGDDQYIIAKISDFGLSKAGTETYYAVDSKKTMPVRWCAPETLKFGKFHQPSDVWSFGILLWELVSMGGVPFASLSNESVLSVVSAGDHLKYLFKPDDCHTALWDVSMACLKVDVAQRTTFDAIAIELRKAASSYATQS